MDNSCKLRILENFISVDYVCFGDCLKKIKPKATTTVREYLELKAALGNILGEIYELVGFHPSAPEKKIQIQDLYETARDNAVIARKNSKTILESEQGRKYLNLKVGENVEVFSENVETDKIVDYTIHEKAIQVALDNLLIARMIKESENIDKLTKSFEGSILEDAYKHIRDALIEKAIQIMSE